MLAKATEVIESSVPMTGRTTLSRVPAREQLQAV